MHSFAPDFYFEARGCRTFSDMAERTVSGFSFEIEALNVLKCNDHAAGTSSRQVQVVGDVLRYVKFSDEFF